MRARKILTALIPMVLASGILVAGSPPAMAGAPYSCVTSAAMGECPADGTGYTSYAGVSAFSSHWNSGSPYVDADMWGPVAGETQTVSANSPGDWQATVTIPPGSNPSGAVTTYPDAGMQFAEQPLTTFGDITSSLADTVPQDSSSTGWQGYDNWYNAWGDEVMIQTNYAHQSPCTFAAVQQFGGSNGVPVQTWGLCDFGGPGGEKVWQLAQPGAQAGGENDYSVMETSGSVDISAMTDWLITHGYMLTSTEAATTLTALSAGFEVTETPAGGSTWTYSDLTFENHAGGQSAPLATTDAASGVTSMGATLNGSVNPEGAATTYQFDYGTTTSYGTSVPSGGASAGSGTSAVSENYALTGLSPSATYHYRIEATNSGGTSYGADQQFTTSASGGGGSVAYDAVSKAKGSGTSLSWTHTAGAGSNRALLVEAALGDTGSDAGCSTAVTDNGTAMTRLATVHANNQHSGYVSVFGLAGPPSGASTIAVTVTGCGSGTKTLTGGAVSFTGASQSAPFGTPVTAYGNGSTASASLAATSAGDLAVAFAADGSGSEIAQSPFTSRFVQDANFNSGAGNSAGATAPASGSSMTASWGINADWWGEFAVEVQHA